MRKIIICCVVFLNCLTAGAETIRGVSLAHLHHRGAGYGSEACVEQLKAIAKIGANWVALNDFSYMPKVEEPGLVFDRDPSMTRDDLIKTVADAHKAGLKVLIKPHIWSNEFWTNSKWHGDIKMRTDADWDIWFAAYTRYVLYNAAIAQEAKADAVSVGVELEGTTGRSAQWRALIVAVREIYKGPVCYSAAFEEWKRIDWWDAVDVIGITAYWPLSDQNSPDDAAIRQGWKKVYDQLDELAVRTGKTICFTELGYTPSTTAARMPWSYQVEQEDASLQARLYDIAIDEAGKRPYIRGVFVWKWFTSHDWQLHEKQDAFAVQNRPQTLEALRRQWSR